MKLQAYFVVVFLVFLGYLISEKKNSNTGEIKATTYISEYGGYGYDILIDEKCVIHQPHIPVIPNTVGFPDHESAKKAALMVIDRIKKNEMPPALTTSDLRKLQLIN